MEVLYEQGFEEEAGVCEFTRCDVWGTIVVWCYWALAIMAFDLACCGSKSRSFFQLLFSLRLVYCAPVLESYAWVVGPTRGMRV